MEFQTAPAVITAEGQHFTAKYTEPITALNHVLCSFAPTSLKQMENVNLLRRIDTKYVLSEMQLYKALCRLTADYDVLEIEGHRWHRYHTLYFDTSEFALYRQHHDGWRKRFKVRSRTYLDTGLAFLEVKEKTNKDITVKHRLQTPAPITHLNADTKYFLHTCFPYTAWGLERKLGNTFRRITLVSKHGIERLTLDINLGFQTNEKVISLPGVAIAEVKQEAFSLNSAYVGQMRALGVRAMHISKYCTGVTLLYDQVKSNNFKPQRLYIDKLIKEGMST